MFGLFDSGLNEIGNRGNSVIIFKGMGQIVFV